MSTMSSRPVRLMHEVHALDGEQQAGQRADQVRAGQPPGDPGDHEDRQRAQHGDGEPPAEGRRAEQVLAGGDRPLAERRVDDEGGVGLEDRRASASCRPTAGACRWPCRPCCRSYPKRSRDEGVLRVVRLVEDDGVRPAEVDEPQEAADDRDDERADPAARCRVDGIAGAQPLGERRLVAAWGRVRARRVSGWPLVRSGALLGVSGRRGPGHRAIVCAVSGWRRERAVQPCRWAHRARRHAARGPRRRVRAASIEALATADVVAAEDTRRVRRLAADLGVTPSGRIVSFYDAVERERSEELVARARGRGDRPRGLRRRHADRQRPRLPARRAAVERGRPGDGPAGPVGRADGAGALGPARRPVLLRGLPAAQGRRAGDARSRSCAPSRGRWCSSRRRTGLRRCWPRWRRGSGRRASRRPSAAS